MITIEEIPIEKIEDFWKIHYKYLLNDEIISDEEDKEYFQSEEYRGDGTGHRCFTALEAYTKADGSKYYEINCERENAHRFWLDNGFVDNGVDEYGMVLMVK